MADSTKELVRLAGYQNHITIAEAILLTVTIFFTAWASIAASRAAKAADAAVKVTREMSEIDLRAYISIQNSHADKLATAHKGRGTFTVENVGKTPAKDIMTWYASFLCPPGVEINWDELPRPDDITRFTKSPSAKFIINVETGTALTEETIIEIRRGEMILYMVGHIDYKDVFNTPHKTSFRYVFAHKAGSGDILNICKDGNEET